MNNGIIKIAALVGLISLVGCDQKPAPVPDPLGTESVASIDGAPIQAALFNHYELGRLQKESVEWLGRTFLGIHRNQATEKRRRKKRKAVRKLQG